MQVDQPHGAKLKRQVANRKLSFFEKELKLLVGIRLQLLCQSIVKLR